MKIDEIRAMLAQAEPQDPCGQLIASGQLRTHDDKTQDYEVRVGWDPVLAHMCDSEWGDFNIHLLEKVAALNLPEEDGSAYAKENLQMEDNHWSWLKKSLLLKEPSYTWFFLVAGKNPQGAALIYHPKPSAFDNLGIYYIEYIAAAPWNRLNPFYPKRYCRVGKALVRHINNYCQKNLKLRPGFSLHALPKAVGFYEALGMVNIPGHDKDGLLYFEMPEPANV